MQNYLKSSYKLLLLLTIGVFIGACGSKEYVDTFEDKGFQSYVYAYTSGVISKVAPIRVRFAQAVIDGKQVGKPVESGLFSTSPAIEGTAIWEDNQTILLQPEKPMPSDTKFTGSVRMNKLFSSIAADLKTFKFGFRTLEQHAEVLIEGLSSADLSDLTKQEVVGTIYTADISEAEAVEKMLEVRQPGNDNLTVRWEHDGDQQYHHFIIENVVRGDKASEVKLEWNGSAIGTKDKGSEKVEVPSVKDFKLMDVRINQEDGQHIMLVFSDPINRAQDLNGLIYVQDLSATYNFTVDGNIVKAYPSSRIMGDRKVIVERGIENIMSKAMGSPSQWDVTFSSPMPMVRALRNGVIMPNSNGLIFPFEAVGLSAIDVEIFKIYENNVLQFLQTNELDGDYELRRVGRVVLQKKIDLDAINSVKKEDDWTRYALDLNTLISREPNAIYQVRIGFQKAYATYDCGDKKATSNLTTLESNLDEDGEIISFWDDNYEWYDYDERNNPCTEGYYKSYYRFEKFAKSNIIASDLGMIAKKGNDNSYFVAVSNLLNTKPMSGISLKFYDYQQQVIKEMKTDGDGIAQTTLSRTPYVIVAEQGKMRGYLKIPDGNALSMSRFDVSGVETQKGIKGMIYGERGVWRPGDTLFLNFILEDKKNQLPDNHPVTMELYDARGQLYSTITKTDNVEGIYDFTTVTRADDGTGSWLAKVKVGGAIFQKNIRVETVKPNRIKIKIDFGQTEIYADNDLLKGNLQLNWLHGAPARNLKAEVKVQLQSIPTKFSSYGDFNFDDPARSFSSAAKVVFEGKVDAAGSAAMTAALNTNNTAPGRLKANFTTRAFEDGGDFSTDNFSMTYNPYAAYVGIRLPEKKYSEKRLDMDKDETLRFVVLDAKGKPLANRTVALGLYKVNWRWWWDSSDDEVTNFSSSNHYGALNTQEVKTNNKGEAVWTVKLEDWGRYMIRACDKTSGHCTGEIFYAGYPWDDNNMKKDAAAMLSIEADKEQYNVGETVELKIPMGKAGRALITIENGSRVVETHWMVATEGENVYRFTATAEMTPNIYAHVSLLQPHAQVLNDLPIRMYGITPIRVEDPNTKLEPVAAIKDEIRPNERFAVKVSESKGKAMAYTLAIVDEGLLDLTRFATPEPWKHFYAREALGVKTWDMYDYVMGAYGGKLERILSIGGDMDAKPIGKQKANRFTPVVMHLGPFYLKAGETKTHNLTMPNYVGAVRTMVVAAKEGAYGHFEKSVKVRKPLMVLGTLPRVLSPTESVKLPVTVFAMDKKIKNVTVKIQMNNLLKINGVSTKTLTFNSVGDDVVSFDLNVADNIGIGTVKITATSGNETAYQEIELDVRNPNPFVSNVLEAVLAGGVSKDFDFEAVGMFGTNEGVLEVSNIPPINLGERLKYLLQYPHGCIEQTTSSGFPQLYVSRLMETDKAMTAKIERNINATIDRITTFQVNSGGFAYWPGNTDENDWGTNYGGHFLLEAQTAGYNVPKNTVDNWKKYQISAAKKWSPKSDDANAYYRNDDLVQAYRLYTLALAKAPEWAAMNRLRQKKDLSNTAKWRLAAAYAMGGKTDAAKQLIAVLPTTVQPYQELGYSYGSDLRDRAMILETLTILNDKTKAAKTVIDLSKSLSSKNWYSTQTTAYALLAIGKYVGDEKTSSKFNFAYQIGGKGNVNAGSNSPLVQVPIAVDKLTSKKVSIKNTDKQQLFVRLILSGQPVIGDATAAANDLKMTIRYTDLKGTTINPSKLMQGTDFIAEVQIQNPGIRGRYDELALSQIFPSGWEIYNTRMNNVQNFTNTNVPEYQDIRDDRVYSYFDLNANSVQVYRVQLNAAYEGRYYLPTVECSAMYDNSISARQPGQWVEVVAAGIAAN